MDETIKYEALCAEEIGYGLSLSVSVLPEVDSTNTEARRKIMAGERLPQLILAETQSAGRGRMGRSFYSPEGVGIYLSLCFEVGRDGRDPLLLTTAAAVAVWRAIHRVTGIECGIKWVNDLYVDGRKVCGILAESLFLGEKRYVILGVGVNLYTREFPEELREIAGGLGVKRSGLRNTLAAALGAELSALIDDPMPHGFIELYRKHSLVLGREITYTENGASHRGIAESVDERGRLTVRHADGSGHLLASGEITLRIQQKKGES